MKTRKIPRKDPIDVWNFSKNVAKQQLLYRLQIIHTKLITKKETGFLILDWLHSKLKTSL